METFDIDGIELFKTGFWNGREYTEKDIEQIVESYNQVGHLVKPYLKLGHDEGQELLQKDGFPAAGWITDLRKVGSTLVGNIKNVPKKIKDLIDKKAFGRISIEMFKNLKIENKIYDKVLKGAALLGADTPAVTSLNDFIDLYENNEYEEIIVCNNYSEVMDMDEKTIDVNIKDTNEMKITVENFTKEIEDLKKKLSDSEKANLEFQKKLEVEKFTQKEKDITSFLDEKVKEGKVLPSQIDLFKHLVLGEEKEDVLVFNQKEKSQIDLVKEIIEINEQIDFSEQSQAADTGKNLQSSESSIAGEEIAEKAIAFMRENKVDYATALQSVTKEV